MFFIFHGTILYVCQLAAQTECCGKNVCTTAGRSGFLTLPGAQCSNPPYCKAHMGGYPERHLLRGALLQELQKQKKKQKQNTEIMKKILCNLDWQHLINFCIDSKNSEYMNNTCSLFFLSNRLSALDTVY